MRSRPYLDLPDPQICCRVTGGPGQRIRMALGPQDLPWPFVIACCVGHVVIHLLRVHTCLVCPQPGLERPAPNRGELGDVSVYDLDLSDHWSPSPFSNFQQPSMPVSMLRRGGLGRNGCSACSLPPRDPTVVTFHWCLESERYTIDSGA
jgi:hypothetical protein